MSVTCMASSRSETDLIHSDWGWKGKPPMKSDLEAWEVYENPIYLFLISYIQTYIYIYIYSYIDIYLSTLPYILYGWIFKNEYYRQLLELGQVVIHNLPLTSHSL